MSAARGPTWLPVGQGASWPAVTALAPEVFAALADIGAELDDALPTELVELCRARMAMLLGAAVLDSSAAHERRAALAAWPTSPLFSGRDRACLALAEQFVMDVTRVEQQQVDQLLAYLTPQQTLAFVTALWLEEAMLRLRLVLGVDCSAQEA